MSKQTKKVEKEDIKDILGKKTNRQKKDSQAKKMDNQSTLRDKKEVKKTQITDIKIKFDILDDSNFNDVEAMEDYINNKKNEFASGKINLDSYIDQNDIDNEQIAKYLENILLKDANKFFESYKNHFFKLTFEQRIIFQKKIEELPNIEIPEYITKNLIKETTNIENIFINILSDLINLIIDEISIKKIEEIFIKNNVLFDKEIDIKVPYKYGTRELMFYSLLNDIFFYFHDSNLTITNLFGTFQILETFINNIIKEDENLISKCNYLFNILYMYLEIKSIDIGIFADIVSTCIPFKKELANLTLNNFKFQKKKADGIFINKTPIAEYTGEITGNEIVTLEYKTNKIKIEILSKYINWNLGIRLGDLFKSEDYMLCITFPENTKYNIFTIDGMESHVNKFFNDMIRSPPMKQAMIIDTEASKYKYLFNNEKKYYKNLIKMFIWFLFLFRIFLDLLIKNLLI